MTAPQTGAVGDPFAAFQTPGASYIDPVTGQPIEGAASAPVGTPFYQSSQLVQNPNTGATASATGTEANPFAGFVDDAGGGFGYSGPVNPNSTDPSDPANPNRGLYMDAASSDPTRIATALNSADPNAQGGAIERLTAPAATGGNQLGALEDSTTAGSFTPAWFQSLSPDAQAQVTAGLKAGGGDPQAIDQQLASLGAPGGNVTKVGGDTVGTFQYNTDPAAVTAANAADALLPNTTPAPVDADPFGQFDSAQNPTHGVITPQYEAQLAAQSQNTLLNETQPGAVPAAAASSATAPLPGFAPTPALAGTNVGVSGAPASVDPNNPFAQFTATGAPTTPTVIPSATAPVAPTLSPTGN